MDKDPRKKLPSLWLLRAEVNHHLRLMAGIQRGKIESPIALGHALFGFRNHPDLDVERKWGPIFQRYFPTKDPEVLRLGVRLARVIPKRHAFYLLRLDLQRLTELVTIAEKESPGVDLAVFLKSKGIDLQNRTGSKALREVDRLIELNSRAEGTHRHRRY